MSDISGYLELLRLHH
nr:unnamed protein product [Callosobruchus chinensis]